MTRQAGNIKVQVLLKGPATAKVGGTGLQVLYRKIPIASPIASARSGSEAINDAHRDPTTYGRSSVSVRARASAMGQVVSASTIDYDVGVVRWMFVDERTGETWTVFLNPNEMGPPPASKNLKRAIHTRGYARMSTMQTPTTIEAWSFDGLLLTEAHYNKLQEWALKPGITRIYDHLGRVFQVLIETFVPHEPAGRAPDSWKMKYTVNTQFLRRLK